PAGLGHSGDQRWDGDRFCCPVCLEVLRDPVTIPCGHSYCLDCIEDYWNRAQQRGQYSCPQCRQVFNPRPLLSRNTVLGEVVEKFLQSEAQARPAAKEVKCGVCRGRRSRAVRTCLTSSVGSDGPAFAPHVHQLALAAHDPVSGSPFTDTDHCRPGTPHKNCSF
uniref:RING-type domain-containing protein n=1 Tax=Mola mola TaxID=94237 RepID=A0A3Q3WJQ9_MOLML